MAVYQFVGVGLGVPGLPHRITKREAEAAGMGETLAAAVAAGTYRAVMPDMPEKPARKKRAGREVNDNG